MHLYTNDMAKPKYDIIEVGETFVYGRLHLDTAFDIYNSITEEVDEAELEEGEIGGDENDEPINTDIRSNGVHWIRESKKARKLTQKLIDQINEDYFELEFSESPDWQWTVYQDVDDHYSWHKDEDEDDLTDFQRKLSISICCTPSELYEGAEFFIKDGCENNIRVFKMGYGEFIVFPSEIEHRVNALRAGERESLVVWFGDYWD